MGLDMFLYKASAEKVKENPKVFKWIDSKIKDNHERYGSFRDYLHNVFFNSDYDPSLKAIKLIGQWRKSNQIHNFFRTKYYKEKEDNFIPCAVKHEDLIELNKLCLKVLEKREEILKEESDLAEDKLPTLGGFFFGTTQYNESYFEDLKETIEILRDYFENYNETDLIIYLAYY